MFSLCLSAMASAEAEKKPAELVDPMVGADIQELMSVYGKPTIVLTHTNGRRIYTYDASLKTHFRQDGRRCNDAYVIDADDMVIDYYCR